MSENEYTPTTEQVRGGYSIKPPGHSVLRARERQAAEFDRWHQAEIVAAEQRGAARELRQAALEWSRAGNDANVYAWLHSRADKLDPPSCDKDYETEFDRWLAEHDTTIEAAAEQRGAEKSWDRCVDHVLASCTYTTSTAEEWRHYQLINDLRIVKGANPYRADQITDQEDNDETH